MKIGFMQFEPVFGDIAANLERIEALSRGVDAELLVLPELCNTGYLFTAKEELAELGEEIPHGRTTEHLCSLAKDKNVFIVAGIAERAGDIFYNSSVLVSPQGYMATYRKVHLFYEEKRWFQPGDSGFEVYDIGPCRLGMMICFDWIFPESMRILSLKGADIVCHSANLVLPYCQEAMVTRCLENRVYAVTCNRTGTENRGGNTLTYTGKSQITGHRGEILHRAGEDSEEVGVVDIAVEEARDKQLNEYNDLFKDRRMEFYDRLV